MKLKKKLALMLIVICLLSVMMLGCTPDKDQITSEAPSLPTPNMISETTAKPADTKAAQEGSIPEATEEPAGSHEVPGPVSTEEPEPVLTEGSGHEATEETIASHEDPTEYGPDVTEEDGLEVESEYNYEIGDNLGVGGN